MSTHKELPVLVVDDELHSESVTGCALHHIVRNIAKRDMRVFDAISCEEAWLLIQSRADIGCILVDWDLKFKHDDKPGLLIHKIRERNEKVPIILMAERTDLESIPTDIFAIIEGTIWITEDTPHFIAGHIEEFVERYHKAIKPPFFNELAYYADECKYSWHTPGHMGGVAFLKSPAGREFFNFFGENVFRADLSVSVPELGSLMEHTDVLGEAEAKAAKTFGADNTFFVTNGTSTANKMVFHGTVTPGDIVIADRNCHKSHMHAMTMTRVKPVYLIPSRNEYGIIGPIHFNEFKKETIQKKLEECPFIKDPKKERVALTVVTNSTYDGLCYNADMIKAELAGMSDAVLFDEAWYGYAKFHPLYAKRFGMYKENDTENTPLIFSTQSTHKLLAAFSQASMVHVKHDHLLKAKDQFSFDRFNEAFMMHTSTSPQYGIIASLDVATEMMSGKGGESLTQDTIQEALSFRKKMVTIGEDLRKKATHGHKRWWYTSWQPDEVPCTQGGTIPLNEAEEHHLTHDPECWSLKPDCSWHGFSDLPEDYMLLDPIKVTLVTPGINRDWSMQDWGIPAGIVTRYLRKHGIVVEKTGHYSFLVLFSMGITKGKSGSLIAELFEFKRLFDENVPLNEVFPELLREHQERYKGMTIQDFCLEMHTFYKEKGVATLMEKVYGTLPEQVFTPAEAYDRLVRGNVVKTPIEEVSEKIAATMIVPYPPGIPTIMPGERFSKHAQAIVDYLIIGQEFDNKFPGFENEVHGIMIDQVDGRTVYSMYCLEE